MISNQKTLFDFIDNIMKPFGFIKKKDTWYQHTNECICFLCVGKSPYGGYYGEVLGCFLKEINQEKEEYPKYYKCNLKYGISDIIENKDLIKKVFNLENNDFENENEREIILKDLFENYALPFLKDISTKEGIKIALKKYKGLIIWMDVEMKKALSIED